MSRTRTSSSAARHALELGVDPACTGAPECHTEGNLGVEPGREHLDVALEHGHLLRPDTRPHGSVLGQLAGLGFTREDVRHVIPTHLDLDHAGGLPDFPEAQVHVFEAEHRAAMERATLQDRTRYRRQHFAHGPRWDLRSEEGERWFGFAGVRAIDRHEEILLIPLIGHTRGHCGVAVRNEQGWLLHAGDAYFFHGELERPPRCPPGLVLFQLLAALDNRQRRANQDRLRELVHAHGSEVEVHSAHCPVELERYLPR